MTLEQLQFEDYQRRRERRRQNLINPNRQLTWQEARENGEMNDTLVLSGLWYGTLIFGTFIIFTEVFCSPAYQNDHNLRFHDQHPNEKKD
jgi:hypothetical protein